MQRARSGFTILELSVVIAIIGLLVGAIIGGRSMLNAASVNKVLTDATVYKLAAQSFRDQYEYLPGDLPTATSLWGDDNASCPDGAITNGSPGTCNGNGNGRVDVEQIRMWQHLWLAQYIDGNYSGLTGPDGASHIVPGYNAPIGSIRGSSYALYSWGEYDSSSVTFYEGNYNNALIFGLQTTALPAGNALTPAQAYSIDEKADDKMPGMGKIRTLKYAGSDTQGRNCASSTALTATYRRSDNRQLCHLLFLWPFKLRT